MVLTFGRAVLGAAFAILAAVPGQAQMAPPPGSAEAAEVAACLCLRRAVDALGGDMAGRQQAYEASRGEVAALDAQLQGMRASLNVDDPRAVAQYRQLLERRDAANRRSSGAQFSEYSAVVERYGARGAEYNARCANRPQNAAVVAQVQASLSCPPY